MSNCQRQITLTNKKEEDEKNDSEEEMKDEEENEEEVEENEEEVEDKEEEEWCFKKMQKGITCWAFVARLRSSVKRMILLVPSRKETQ